MSEWTAEPADEHGTPGLWRHGDGEPQLRYIARPDGSDDRRVPADAYRLLRRVLVPTPDVVDQVAQAMYASAARMFRSSSWQWLTEDGRDRWRAHARAGLAALAEQTGDE